MGIIEENYQAAQGKLFETDSAQIEAVIELQTLYDQLNNEDIKHLTKKAQKESWWGSPFDRRKKKRPEHGQGLYLWGGVGRGKTWLMDLFYNSLHFEQKLRLHFRHFMQDIHEELANLSGQQDPLLIVAKHYAHRTQVICLDEFFVEDIADAIVLYHLLDAFMAEGIVMIFTSNLAPEDLYKNGLQRDRFLPAIELIENCTNVFHLSGDTDHRLRKLTKAETYFSPVDKNSEIAMEKRFIGLAPNKGMIDMPLNINHRQIPSLRCADDVVWFNFFQLCQGPRSSADYIELARRFHTVLISGVPVMGEGEEDLAHRFIDLVDEFYDRRVKLIISAETTLINLYHGRKLLFEFRRTISRLMEMRSEEYLGMAHRP